MALGSVVRRMLTRLRWQLTVSHLVATAFTLVSMVGAIVLLASLWIAAQNSPVREPAHDARLVAGIVGGLVAHGVDAADVNTVLRLLVQGDLWPQAGPGPFSPEPAQRIEPFGPSLRDLAYIAVLGPDGRALASSEPAGAAFAPAERPEWLALHRTAMTGQRDPRSLVTVRSGPGPAALGAFPIAGDTGRPIATVIVAKSALPQPNRVANVVRGLAIFSAATVGVLAGSSVFALVSSGLVAYLLAGRLVSRLERVGRAAEALADGDLRRRVEEGPPDEVGLLARRFNRMADRLAESLAELAAQSARAERLLQTKRELVANVSHELRTPLASIRGHTESLLMSADAETAERRREYLAVIHRESEQLSRLIDDLFLLSTGEEGALSLTIRPVALAEVIDEVAVSFRALARRERQVTVVTESDPDLPPAMADRDRVVQVLGNLVRNALRHTPEGGLVSIRAERAADVVQVVVEDTGVGIPADQLAQVFDRFYRGDDARDRASGGAGLGLAIVRELVENMGGTVLAESEVGRGSRFGFRLPVADGASMPLRSLTQS